MRVRVNKVVYDRVILHDQEIDLGQVTLISGRSGVGKSTLLKQLMTNYKCGYVSQDPDNQIVCDTVWHEMAFGLENIGTPSSVIRLRVAEVATYLGLESIINKDVMELSGGQKQKVCLASVLCMSPELILLDEPTAMLDPISSREFWSVVDRLAKDKGIRFVIVEHNPYVARICDVRYTLSDGIIGPYKIYKSSLIKVDTPLNPVKYTLSSIRKSYGENLILNIPKFTIVEGVNCVVGPNGIGKSTLLRMITGGFGEKKLIKSSVLMPQDVKMMFSKDTVREELDFCGKIPDELKPHLNKHPLDLSGGEQHYLGVYLTLNRIAGLYCFDEPTKGMDKEIKHKIMKMLESSGKDILMVSHDLDIVAEYSNKVSFLFNREIAAEGTSKQVFSNNLFYKPEVVEWT